VELPAGVSLACSLRKEGVLQQAAVAGIQRLGNEDWEDVPLFYVPKASDYFRIRYNKSAVEPGLKLAALLKALFSSVTRRKKRVPTGNRRHKE
jgi:hypothetical protein